MSKRKPTSSHPGINRFFYKSQGTESQGDEGDKTGNCDQQTPFSCVRKQENTLIEFSFSKIFWGSMPPDPPWASGPVGLYATWLLATYRNATVTTLMKRLPKNLLTSYPWFWYTFSEAITQYFSITLKVILTLSDCYKISTNCWL